MSGDAPLLFWPAWLDPELLGEEIGVDLAGAVDFAGGVLGHQQDVDEIAVINICSLHVHVL